MIDRSELVQALDQLLEPHQFKDYCPNGLQVEGKADISRLVTGVTACQALINKAIALRADAVIVHHGYFWKGESESIVGIKRARIKALLDNNISLFAYHLPLDVHPQLGNNAQLGKLLGLNTLSGLEANNPRSVGCIGELPDALSVEDFSELLSIQLNRAPQHIGSGSGNNNVIKTVAWCTGAAQGYIDLAADAGVDAYISGEISEPTVHIARERGIHYFAAGHHATERYGVKALGEQLAKQYELDVVFVDIDNPV